MKTIYLSLLLAAQACYGLTPPITLGSQAHSLSHFRFTQNDIWSVYNAPCAMRPDSNLCVGLSFASPYWLNELKTISAAVHRSFRNQTYGICVTQHGYRVLNSSAITLAASQQLNTKSRLGVSLRYYLLRYIENETRLHSLRLSTSWQTKLNKRTMLFGSVSDIPTQIRDLRYLRFTSALSHKLTPETQVHAQLSFTTSDYPDLLLGLQHTINNTIVVYGAVGISSAQFSAGLRLNMSKWIVTTSYSQHQRLRHSQDFDVQLL